MSIYLTKKSIFLVLVRDLWMPVNFLVDHGTFLAALEVCLLASSELRQN